VFALRASIAAMSAPIGRDARREVCVALLHVLTGTLPVVVAVTFFAGAMLLVQAAASLSSVGGGALAGLIVGFGGVRDVFPLLSAAALAARTGAALASELSTMRVTQQLDALSTMGIDPERLLVGPRVLATALAGPLCVIVGDTTGLLGAHLVGAFQLGVDRGAMWQSLFAATSSHDVVIGAAKGVVLGWLVGVVSTREGLRAAGGPAGVGRATNRAIVRSMIAVCLANLALTLVLYGRVSGPP
jgi:phospholipid/cholesterol/gamma-HCH transport system permease protein